MKQKRKTMAVLVAFMLVGLVLAGCGNRDNDNTQTEITDIEPSRDRHPSHDTNRPPPERNPDGSIG